MQRVRIGLTGLALVFVLVLLGAVVRSASDDETANANGLGRQVSIEGAANEQDSQATEPLAELGVAPGNADSNSISDASNSGAKN
jgi:hypothetical protein